MDPASIITLISVLAPLATNLILMLTHPDGSQTIIAKVQAAEALNAQNAKDLEALLSKTAPPAK